MPEVGPAKLEVWGSSRAKTVLPQLTPAQSTFHPPTKMMMEWKTTPNPTSPLGILRSTRANPFPKVTGLFCRLPLPALFILSRGCSPWGPAAVIGTPRREIILQMDFQGLSLAYWTPGTPRRSSHSAPVSPDNRIPQGALSQVKQKRKLCPVPPLTSPPQFASPPPHPCARILTRFPFADRKNDYHPA